MGEVSPSLVASVEATAIGAGNPGGKGGIPGGRTSSCVASEADEEEKEAEEIDLQTQGHAIGDIEDGAGVVSTESEEESSTSTKGLGKISGRQAAGGKDSDEGERPDLRTARGACLRYLCHYAFLVKVLGVTGDDWEWLS